MKWKLAYTIRNAREDLTRPQQQQEENTARRSARRFPPEPGIPPPVGLTKIENQCFANCIEVIKRALEKLPEDAVKSDRR